MDRLTLIYREEKWEQLFLFFNSSGSSWLSGACRDATRMLGRSVSENVPAAQKRNYKEEL